jgi:D-3-phosphoglycerate dehydrogenase
LATPFRLTSDCRIAIDLDGVLTEHPRPLAHAASERFGLDLPERAFVDSAGLNVPEAVREWVYGPEGPAAKLRIAPGAASFLHRVIDAAGQNNVIIITARPTSSVEPTLAWMKTHGLPPVEVYFAEDKVKAAQTHNCLCAVEDSVRHAKAYAAAGIHCYLVNAETNGLALPDQITVARSLEDIVGMLTGELPSGSETTRSSDTPPLLTDAPARPRIVISDAIHPDARATLAAAADLVDVDGTDLPALLAVLGDADALVVRSETIVSRDVLAAGPRLRVVARAGVGVDTVDLEAATEAGVLVLNAPGANATSAGEHTISLLLALTRQIPFANETTHAGQWQRKNIRAIDLKGRVAGIVGLGRVGSVVARRLRAFEMELIGYDPYVGPERFRDLNVTPVDYPTLLARCDVLTYHVPSTPETFHMLDASAIQRLKPTALVLNCARGDVVDQDALADAIREGRIAGAGVDVFPHEPTTSSPLFGLPNVVLTPHTGGSSAEALAAVGQVISTTTLAALRGEAVPNAVNMPGASVDAPALRRLTTVACAAGKLLAVLEPKIPRTFQLVVHGQAPAGIAEHVLGAALSEALRRWADRRVTAVNAKLVAGELGVTVRTISGDVNPERMPAFTLQTSGANPHRVTLNWDMTSAGIVEVDRFSLERALAGDVLITHHVDQPGVIGHLGMILGRHNVNIAGMQVGRHQRGGEAIMVTNVDDEIPPQALAEILEVPGLTTAYVVSLPAAEPRQALMPDLVTVGD